MTKEKSIKITGARTNNLKNIDVQIKINKITCIYGPSGSGKSSLAFHTLHAESKRRFINSFPSSQKFFEDVPQRPDVDNIEPVLPVWTLPQGNPVLGSRMSTVDLLDLESNIEKLFYIFGSSSCPQHHIPLVRESMEDVLENLNLEGDIVYFFLQKNDFLEVNNESIFPARSFNSEENVIRRFDSEDSFWEIFRLKTGNLSQIKKKLNEINFDINKYKVFIYCKGFETIQLLNINKSLKCKKCSYTLEHEFSSPVHLSPFNGVGSCSTCKGYGSELVYSRNKLVKYPWLSIKEGAISVMELSRFRGLIPEMEKYFKRKNLDLNKPFEQLPEKKWKLLFEGDESFYGLNYLLEYLESKKYKKNIRIYLRGLQEEIICRDCHGVRLNQDASNYTVEGISLENLFSKSLDEAIKVLIDLRKKNTSNNHFVKLVDPIIFKLNIASEVSLGHLTLKAKVKNLKASEYQRLLLVKYFSFIGSGSLFIFDEASLGLNVKEQNNVLKFIKKLRDQGNTVLLVDHSEIFKKNSDEVIAMGPTSGKKGGEILYQGKYFKENNFNFEKLKISFNTAFKFEKVNTNFLNKSINLTFPAEGITWVHGESNSSKDEIILETLVEILNKELNFESIPISNLSWSKVNYPKDLKTLEVFTSKSLRANSRSTVGTFLDLTGTLRKVYAKTEQAKSLVLRDGHFSPNSELGACPTCEGRGVLVVDMKFLENVIYECPDCSGKKIRPLYANISYQGLTFHESLNVSIEEAFKNIKLTPKLNRILKLLEIMNLSYLNLDRGLTSLSGGEQQRLKLLLFLIKKPECSLLIFENLSFGLSEFELARIANYFNELVQLKNTILILDPNPIFKKICHWSLEFDHKNTIKSARC